MAIFGAVTVGDCAGWSITVVFVELIFRPEV